MKRAPRTSYPKYTHIDWLHEPVRRQRPRLVTRWDWVMLSILTIVVAILMYYAALLRFGL